MPLHLIAATIPAREGAEGNLISNGQALRVHHWTLLAARYTDNIVPKQHMGCKGACDNPLYLL